MKDSKLAGKVVEDITSVGKVKFSVAKNAKASKDYYQILKKILGDYEEDLCEYGYTKIMIRVEGGTYPFGSGTTENSKECLTWLTNEFGIFFGLHLFIRAEGLIPRPSGAKQGVLNPTAIPYENTIPRCSAAGLVIYASKFFHYISSMIMNKNLFSRTVDFKNKFSTCKKNIVCLLIFLFSFQIFAKELSVPADNSVWKKSSAISLLELCTGHSDSKTVDVFNDYGFKTIKQVNYSRPKNQIDHSSAYTIGRGKILVEGKSTTAYLDLVVIRGTDGTEWFSNFDFVPSASNDAHFAMNFLSSAEDVFLEINKIIRDKNSTIILAGHSRGAAVANILTLLLNQVYDFKNVYAYTFATPLTIKNLENLKDQNIFNFLNPCDLVPQLPLKQWGFKRAGTDIFLDSDSLNIDSTKVESAVESLSLISPSVESYYTQRHSLTKPGLDKNGLTSYEIMIAIATEFSKLTVNGLQNDKVDMQNLDLNFSKTDISFPSIDTGSDFTTLFGYLFGLIENSGKGFNDLLNEHMPDTYRKKLEKLSD